MTPSISAEGDLLMFRYMIFLIFILLASSVYAAEVEFNWNTVDTATGYTIYYGTESGVYTESIQATAPPLRATIPNGLYYFVATASNEHGESGYSKEISANILPAPKLTITISYTIGE